MVERKNARSRASLPGLGCKLKNEWMVELKATDDPEHSRLSGALSSGDATFRSHQEAIRAGLQLEEGTGFQYLSVVLATVLHTK